LLPHGIRADLTASEYVGESLAQAILDVGGVRRVLIPRARVAREQLPESVERHLASMEAYYALGAAGLISAIGLWAAFGPATRRLAA